MERCCAAAIRVLGSRRATGAFGCAIKGYDQGLNTTAGRRRRANCNLHQEIGEQSRLAHAQIFAGYIARSLGQRTVAQHYFFQALQSTDVHNGFLTLLFVLPGIALLLADAGETERAIEIYAQIADVPLVANSQMRWDLAGAHLASVAATLSPEVASAAQARSRADDLWATAAALLVELGRRGWNTR